MLRTFSETLTVLLLLATHSVAIAEKRSVDRTLWSVDWNPNGSQFAVGGVNTLWLFDAKTFERKSLLSVGSQDNQQADDAEYTGVTTVSWHPLHNHLAVSSQGGNVNGIYDTDSGTRIPLKVDHGRGIDWRTRGDILATTSPGDGHLRVFNSDGSLLHDTPRYKAAKGLTGVAWQPSGNKIVTIGKYITLHDANGTVNRQITHRPDATGECLLLCVEWHPSGEFFVVGDYGNKDTADPPTIQFWSAHGDLMMTIAINEGSEVRNISWNHEGTLLASASDKLRIWTKAGELKHEGDSPDLLWGVDWHPKGHRLLTSSAEGRVTLWTPNGKVFKRIVEAETAGPSNSVATSEVEATPKLDFSTIIRSMMEDSRGNLWIGSDREGVCRFDGKDFTYFTQADGLSDSQIRFIQEDKNGVVWFGTGKGVCSYDATIKHLPRKPRIIHHPVEPAEKGSDQADTGWKNAADHLWFDIGNHEGVCCWDGDTLKKVLLPLLEGSDSKYSYAGDMTDIAYGANSQLWISSYPGVLGHNDAEFTMLQDDGYHVRSVYEASDGTLWIGNNGIGALTYDGKTVTNFTEKHNVGADLANGSLSSVPRTLLRIFAISEDDDQNMWFGTSDSGIWRYDGEELTNFTHKDGLTSIECMCIYRDKQGEMWFGMGNGTICKFDGERFQTAF